MPSTTNAEHTESLSTKLTKQARKTHSLHRNARQRSQYQYQVPLPDKCIMITKAL